METESVCCVMNAALGMLVPTVLYREWVHISCFVQILELFLYTTVRRLETDNVCVHIDFLTVTVTVSLWK